MLYIICADAAVLFYNCRRRELANKEKSEKNKQTAGDLILNENHELESIDEKLFCFFFYLIQPCLFKRCNLEKIFDLPRRKGRCVDHTISLYISFHIIQSRTVYVSRFFSTRNSFFFFFLFLFSLIAGLFYFDDKKFLATQKKLFSESLRFAASSSIWCFGDVVLVKNLPAVTRKFIFTAGF